MKINPFFRWYDLWAGFYIDRPKKTLYFCPLPTIGLKIDFRTNDEILTDQLTNILKWQNNGLVHPLTCGNNSLHSNLMGSIEEGKVILKCIDCDYKQELPEFLK
jgi:hypothetical protein